MRNFLNLEKTLIIAEIGVNHEGDIEKAKEMIQLAAKAGVDAVKFQTYTAAEYVSSCQLERRKRVERFALPHEAFGELAELAETLGVTFFSTPLHSNDVEFLSKITPIIKISSGDLTHLELIKSAAKNVKQLIISTGMGSEEEISAAVNAVKSVNPQLISQNNFMLMHCVAAYPTQESEVNLKNIHWLADKFNVPVGYSDHTLGTKACELAVAAGAIAVEKHFTYRKENQDFHDHHISADPQEMEDLVKAVRNVELYLGQYERKLQASEKPGLQHLRRSLAVRNPVKKGEKISKENIICLRPAWGLLPEEVALAANKTASRDIPAGDIIKKEDVI